MADHFTPKKEKTSIQKGHTALIILLVALVILTAVSLLWIRLPGQKISNPKGTVGNTAGNLNNGGLFCEYNDTVYFSNPFDGGALYAMTSDEEDIRYLSASIVRTILAGGEHLYYFQTGVSGSGDISNIASTHSFNRSDLKGQHVSPLTNNIVTRGQLVDDYLFLLTASRQGIDFYRLKADKSDKKLSLAAYDINPSCAADGVIYYTDVNNNHALYALDIRTNIPQKILDRSIWNPVIIGDYVYYMDVRHNYRLCRSSLSTDKTEILTNDRVDCFNVGSGFIYYQKNGTNPQLICMRTDGTEKKVIAEGNYTHIHMTSRYVYFQEFNKDALYHSRIGSESYSLFQAAMDAIPKKK